MNTEEVIDATADSSPANAVAATETSAPSSDVAESNSSLENEVAELPTKDQEKFSAFEKIVDRAEGKEVKVDSKEKTESEEKPEPETDKDEPVSEESQAKDEDKALLQEHQGFKDRREWQRLTRLDVPEAAKKVIRAELREIYKREAGLSGEVEKLKPAQSVVNEMMDSVDGNEDGFRNMRTLIREHKNNPEKAVPMLEILLNDAKQRAGLVISSPELLTESQTLDKQLQEGLIEQPAYEKRKSELLELQKSRVGADRSQAQLKAEREKSEKTQAQQNWQKTKAELDTMESAWVTDKQKDPDFEILQPVCAAFIKSNAVEFQNQNEGRFPNLKESREILDKSFKQAKAEAMKFRPKPAEKKIVTGGSNGSSANTRQQPLTAFEKFNASVDAAVERRS